MLECKVFVEGDREGDRETQIAWDICASMTVISTRPKGYIAFNIPAGPALMLGVDPAYIAAFKKKYKQCETQYHDAQGLDRRYNAATGAAKEVLAKKLNEAKAKLVMMTNELVSLQANVGDSMADADAQIRMATPPMAT